MLWGEQQYDSQKLGLDLFDMCLGLDSCVSILQPWA